jgi:hypothetical protein
MLAIAYRIAPKILELLLGVSMGVVIVQRGAIPQMSQIIQESMNRRALVWPRFASRNFGIKNSFLADIFMFVDNELFRVWPWLWPSWIGASYAVHHRMLNQVLDERYRKE